MKRARKFTAAAAFLLCLAGFALPRGIVLVYGAVVFVMYLADGAILDWGGLLLTHVQGAAMENAGMGYAIFSLALTIMRLFGGRISERVGSRNMVLLGGIIGAAAFATAVVVGHPIVTFAAFFVLGLAASNITPITFSEAGRQRDMPVSTALAAVTIPAGVTEIGSDAFKGCTGLKRIALSAGLQEIGVGAFKGCTALEAVDIPDSVTALRESAFSGCENLTRVTLPAGLEKIGKSSFAFCGLQSIALPAGLEKIEKSSFSFCELQSIALPAGVKEIGEEAFRGCGKLSEIVWPQALQTIGNDAFAHCESLPAVILPDGVMEIGESAFSGCAGLTEVMIPDSVAEIGKWAFSRCDKLKNVSLPGSMKKIGSGVFGHVPITVRGKKPLIKPLGWHKDWKGKFAVVKYTE